MKIKWCVFIKVTPQPVSSEHRASVVPIRTEYSVCFICVSFIQLDDDTEELGVDYLELRRLRKL